MPSARTLLYLGFAKDEEGEGETEKDYELSLDNWNSPVSEIDCSSFTLHLDILWVHCHFLFLSGSWALAVILNLAFFFFFLCLTPWKFYPILYPLCVVYCFCTALTTQLSHCGLALWCGQYLQIETGMGVCLGGKVFFMSSWSLVSLPLKIFVSFLWENTVRIIGKMDEGEVLRRK